MVPAETIYLHLFRFGDTKRVGVAGAEAEYIWAVKAYRFKGIGVGRGVGIEPP